MMSAAEDWLYNDGFDSTKQQYSKSTHTLNLPPFLALHLSPSLPRLMHFNPLSLLNTLCSISLIVSFYHSHSLTHSLTLTIPPSFNAYIGRRIDEMKALSDPMEARQSEEAQRGAFIPFYLHIAVMGYAVLYCIPPVLLFLSNVSCPLLSRLNSPISPLLSHLFSPALSPTIQHSGNLLEKLREQMDLCKSFANNKDECYSHVTDDERDILRNEGKE